MDEVFFSVIIPVYNVAAYLEECLLSVEQQTYKDYELLLIDDGSTDGSGELCDQLIEKFENGRVIHQANAGLSCARNTGLDAAKGKYIVFIDSDDKITEDALECFHDRIVVGFPEVCTGFAYIWRDGNVKPQFSQVKIDPEKTYSGMEYFDISYQNNSFAACAQYSVCSRNFLEKNHFRFQKGILHEDELWSVTLFMSAQKVCTTSKLFYYHRMRSGSITHSSQNALKRLTDMISICSSIEKMIKEQHKKSVWLNDRLAMLYMSAVYQARNADWSGVKINRFFPLRYAYTPKNRLKALLFLTSPRLYCLVDACLKHQ